MTEPQEPRSAAPIHLTPEELSECAFSPETAAAGWLEHAEGCAECSTQLADLRLVLAQLAELPEPELPESVGIRLDAALIRAWQVADAEAERESIAGQRDAATAAAGRRRDGRRSWRKIALPLGSLTLIVLAVIGIGFLAHTVSSNSSASSSSAGVSAAAPKSNGSITNSALTEWVRSVVTITAGGNATGGGATAHAVQPPKSTALTEEVHCASAPALPRRAGYTVLTTSQRTFDGVPATLVVYQNAQEPASSTVYAVVYAGSCPSSTSEILAQGSVSR